MKDIRFIYNDDRQGEEGIYYGPPESPTRMRLMLMSQGSMGVSGSAERLAKKTAEFLNTLPIEDRCLSPWDHPSNY